MLVQCKTYPELTLYVGKDTRIDFQDGLAEVTAPVHIKAVRDFIADNPDFQMSEVKGEDPETPEKKTPPVNRGKSEDLV